MSSHTMLPERLGLEAVLYDSCGVQLFLINHAAPIGVQFHEDITDAHERSLSKTRQKDVESLLGVAEYLAFCNPPRLDEARQTLEMCRGLCDAGEGEMGDLGYVIWRLGTLG